MSEQERKLAIIRDKSKAEQQGRLEQDSRDRLKKTADKKFRTCYIAALSAFENTFGLELWGHNLPEDTITDRQRANRQRWEQVRKSILDKGNTQARALGMEIDLHRIVFDGYRMQFGGPSDDG